MHHSPKRQPDKFMKTQGIIRHILTFAGGFAVAKGWIDEGTMLELVGGLVTVGGIVWSVIEKNKR